ncbi:MAG: (2Fe-2S)-binding protein [Holosporales bacterium]|nr:(2Fe-2S)-binding protein [Holosporales bacterium]
MNITLVLKDGQEVIVDGNAGDRLMELIEPSDIPVIFACRGAGLCGSCRVKVSDPSKVSPPEDDELDTLDTSDPETEVRLACQVTLTPESDGLRVTLL